MIPLEPASLLKAASHDRRANTKIHGQLLYYPGTDPVVPDRLQKVINPEGETIALVYNEAGRISQMIDPRGIVATEWVYEDDYGRVLEEIHYGETKISRAYSLNEDWVEVTQEDLTGNSPPRLVLSNLDLQRRVTSTEEREPTLPGARIRSVRRASVQASL